MSVLRLDRVSANGAAALEQHDDAVQDAGLVRGDEPTVEVDRSAPGDGLRLVGTDGKRGGGDVLAPTPCLLAGCLGLARAGREIAVLVEERRDRIDTGLLRHVRGGLLAGSVAGRLAEPEVAGRGRGVAVEVLARVRALGHGEGDGGRTA